MPRKTRLALMGAALALASTGVTISIAGVASASGSPSVTTNWSGSYVNGETITVSGTGFQTPATDPSGVEIMECSAAVLTADVPSTAYCDGNTLNPLPIPTDSAGDFSTPYQINQLETSDGSNISCDASNACVLWVGVDYNNDFNDAAHDAYSGQFLLNGTPPAFTSSTSGSIAQGPQQSFQVTASGAPSSLFSETGALPPGMTLSSSGLISGATWGNAGSYPITITAANGVSTAQQSFTLSVTAATTVQIVDTPAPNAVIGQSYSYQLHAVGPFTSPLKWKASGKLPKGLKLNKATGLISGTSPMKKKVSQEHLGNYSFTAEIKDHSKPKKTASLGLSITLVS